MSVDRITFLQGDPQPTSPKSLQIVEEVTAAFGSQTKTRCHTIHTPYDVGNPETTTSTVDFYTRGKIFYRRRLRLCGEQQWSHGRNTMQEVYRETPHGTPVIIQRKRNPVPSKFTGYISVTILPAGVQQILDEHEIPQQDKEFYR